MSVANSYNTYGDVSRKEDVVLNAIETLTAEENSLLSILPKTKAADTVHSYLTDSLATPGSSAVQMGADFTANALSQPSRLSNIVQEIARPIIVSRPQEAVQHYHGQNELSRQTTKALKEWGNSAEFDIIRGSLVSGISGTVAKMAGIINAISKSTNTTLHVSGTDFSATILDALMKGNWDNSNGEVATDLIVGSRIRTAMDAFAQKTNMVVGSVTPTEIVRTVDTYRTSFGTLTVHTHRYIQNSADATGRLRVLGINREKIALAYLDKPMVMDLAKSGAYDKRAVYGSLTVEVRNQDSNFFANGLGAGGIVTI